MRERRRNALVKQDFDVLINVGEAPIYMEKGVATPTPKSNHKWLGRTCEGAYVFATKK
jgi:hypothetical protein